MVGRPDETNLPGATSSQSLWQARWNGAGALLAGLTHREADALTHSIRGGNHTAYYKRVGRRIQELVPSVPDSLLDVGCGTGHWLEFFHIQYGLPFPQMAGVEIGEEAVAYTQARCPGADIRQADVAGSALWGTWQLALSIGVFHHLTVYDDLVRGFENVMSVSQRLIVFPARHDGEEIKAKNTAIKRFWARSDYVNAAREATNGKAILKVDPAKPRFLVFTATE